MGKTASLAQRLERGDILVLDGATGTELEARGAPQTSDAAWADCSATHPEIVSAVHADYVRAGADIITTNTYSTGPHVLRKMGRADKIRPWNTISVELARAAAASDSDAPVLVAGSVSAYGNGAMRYPSLDGEHVWGESDPGQLSANFREQIDILVEAGIDLVLLEFLGATADDIEIGVDAALSFGLPVIASLSAVIDANHEAVLAEITPDSAVADAGRPVGEAVRRIADKRIAAICAMHSEIDDIDGILPRIRAAWPGPLGAYPNRTGFWDGRQWIFTEQVTPDAYAKRARGWVELGATIVGGCCGTTPAMIAAVSAELKAQ